MIIIAESDEEGYTLNQKDTMSSTDSSSSSSDAVPQWTKAEDRALCMMRAEGQSYANIAKELGRGVKESHERHRELRGLATELGITTKQLSKMYIDQDDKKKKKKASKEKSKAKAEDENEGENENEDAGQKEKKKGKGKAKDEGDGQGQKKNKSKKSKNDATAATSSSKGQVDVTVDDDNDGDEYEYDYDYDYEYCEYCRNCSNCNTCGYCSNCGKVYETTESEQERREGRIYHYGTILPQMYPDHKTLRPDRFYSESDCAVLSGLEARDRANKWLYIQADFCNATGRMVEAELLEAKFNEE